MSDASATSDAIRISIPDTCTADEKAVIACAGVAMGVLDADISQVPSLRVSMIHAKDECVYIVVCKVCTCRPGAPHYEFGARNVATIGQWTIALQQEWMARFSQKGAECVPSRLLKM
jgi:hypothetical protein